MIREDEGIKEAMQYIVEGVKQTFLDDFNTYIGWDRYLEKRALREVIRVLKQLEKEV